MADPNAPIGLALTTDGDIELTTSGIRLASGLEAVTNNINSFINLFQGEWFADTELGVPYYQDILGEKYDAAAITAIFRAAIFEVPFVNEIQKISTSFNSGTRTLTVYFEVLTDFGAVSDTVEI